MDSILYWQLIVMGIILIQMVLKVPSFAIFWLGLGFSVTSLLLPKMSLKWQVLLFVASSVGFIISWFLCKKNKAHSF